MQNWRWIIFIGLMILVIPTFIYQEINLDQDLSNTENWMQIQKDFEKEQKELKLPSKTAVNKSENMSKQRTSILVSTRYRTEINENEFVSQIKKELGKKGWIYYDKSENGVEYYFCREKFDAVLNSQGKGSIFGDGANYYQLEFILGLGVRGRSQNMPESCK